MAFRMKRLVVGPMEENCYIVWDDSDLSGVVIDPGDEGEHIAEEIEKEGLTIRYILNTHGHYDHIGANGFLEGRYGAPLAIHPADAPLLEVVAAQAAHLGVEDGGGAGGEAAVKQPAPEVSLDEGTELSVGAIKLKVLHTPGHTQGGVCLYVESELVLFTGDTLFAGSVGRTDLPGGSHETLIESIRTKLEPLPPDVRIFPGHGPESTIGQEKSSNPFLMAG